MSRYEITVTELAQEERVIGKEWKEAAGDDGRWGYTPETTAIRDVTRELYTQNVETLDLAAVIRAVNGLD